MVKKKDQKNNDNLTGLLVYVRTSKSGKFAMVGAYQDQNPEAVMRVAQAAYSHEPHAQLYLLRAPFHWCWTAKLVTERFLSNQELVDMHPRPEHFVPGWVSYYKSSGDGAWYLEMGFYQGDPYRKSSVQLGRHLARARKEKRILRMYKNPATPFSEYQPVPITASEEELQAYFGNPVFDSVPAAAAHTAVDDEGTPRCICGCMVAVIGRRTVCTVCGAESALVDALAIGQQLEVA